jgi:hypothetical protein
MKRKLLDLCCGAGLAGAGYWQSGCFSEIVGIDIDPQFKRIYPFDFICADAFKLDYEFLLPFDFIHASPPCQFYSAITPRWARGRHPRLIPFAHLMLQAAGKPYVIENVPGSGHDLRPNLILSGFDVGLPLDRPRLFHINSSHVVKVSSGVFSQISKTPGSHDEISSSGSSNLRIASAANLRNVIDDNLRTRRAVNVHGDEYVTRDELIEAFGLRTLPVSHLRNLTKGHIEQGIPPAMTCKIAGMLFPKLMVG